MRYLWLLGLCTFLGVYMVFVFQNQDAMAVRYHINWIGLTLRSEGPTFVFMTVSFILGLLFAMFVFLGVHTRLRLRHRMDRSEIRRLKQLVLMERERSGGNAAAGAPRDPVAGKALDLLKRVGAGASKARGMVAARLPATAGGAWDRANVDADSSAAGRPGAAAAMAPHSPLAADATPAPKAEEIHAVAEAAPNPAPAVEAPHHFEAHAAAPGAPADGPAEPSALAEPGAPDARKGQ